MLKKLSFKRKQRAKRIRRKLRAVSQLPRLSVFRSNLHIWAQIIDDQQGKTLAAASSKNLPQDFKGTKTEQAAAVGKLIAQQALKQKLKQVYFDRGSFRFHGRIKALADAARQVGLEF